jgi:hypothetical protein
VSREHKEKLPASIPPRALTIRQVSEYWAVSPNTFKKLVRQGIAPGPINVPGLGRLLFDREQQDRAFARLSGSTEVADLADDL